MNPRGSSWSAIMTIKAKKPCMVRFWGPNYCTYPLGTVPSARPEGTGSASTVGFNESSEPLEPREVFQISPNKAQ